MKAPAMEGGRVGSWDWGAEMGAEGLRMQFGEALGSHAKGFPGTLSVCILWVVTS